MAAARGLDVQPDDQCVQSRVVAGGRGDMREFEDLLGAQGVAQAGQGSRPGYGRRWVVARVDEPVAFGVGVEASEGGDEVGDRAVSVAGVRSHHGVLAVAVDEPADVGGGGFIQAPSRPVAFDDARVRAGQGVAAAGHHVPREFGPGGIDQGGEDFPLGGETVQTPRAGIASSLPAR